MRFLLTGDGHLGKSAHLYDSRLAEQEQVWRATLELARERAVDAVIHCGDLFDSRRPSPEVLVAAERPLVEHQAAGGAPVTLVAGNHDVPSLDGPCGPDVLDEAGLIQFVRSPGVLEVAGVPVGLLPWSPVSRLVAAQGGGDRDSIFLDAADLLVKIATEHHDAGAELLVGHWAVSGSSLPSGLPVDDLRETVIPREPLEQLGFAYVALGHIHRPGHFGDGTAFYVGSPMPLDHGEASVDHGCWLVDMHARETEFVPLPSTRFVTVALDDVYFDRVGHVAGAVVRVKDTVGGSDPVDHAAIRRDLLAAGAKRVDLQITIERMARPDREPVLDTDRSLAELVGAWLDQEGVEDSERLLELARGYLAGDRAAVA
ncbi:MAG: exonuclease SbcCD subunit D [Polyangiaceae bacterium]|nr:exonuclease SbcCD subunit D [Polyangiaceae bacterium]